MLWCAMLAAYHVLVVVPMLQPPADLSDVQAESTTWQASGRRLLQSVYTFNSNCRILTGFNGRDGANASTALFYVNGGNSFNKTAVLGTLDANALQLTTSNTTRVQIDAVGDVCLSAGVALHVSGPTGQYDIALRGPSTPMSASYSLNLPVALGNTNDVLSIASGGQTVWQPPDLARQVVSATSTLSTTSNGVDVLSDLVLQTNATGTYLILFSSTVSSTVTGAVVTVTLYVGGAAVPATAKALNTAKAQPGGFSASIVWVQALTVGQQVDIRWNWNQGAGTASMSGRSLALVRLS